MPDPDISPVPDSPKPEGTAHYRAEDDIELPPMSTEDGTGYEGAKWSSTTGDPLGKRVLPKAIGVAILLGVVAFGGWFATRGGSLEKQHENWQHVAAAEEASTDTQQSLIHIDGSGTSHALTSIELTSAEADRNTTRQVRAALRRNDLVTATAMLQDGQRMPSAAENAEVRPPILTADSELATALKDGRKELYQIELFDCCHEDGDIVEVLVNGSSFATVPIMHGGTMLSIPLDRGNNTVTVRGGKDGGVDHTLGVVVQ